MKFIHHSGKYLYSYLKIQVLKKLKSMKNVDFKKLYTYQKKLEIIFF